MSNSSIQKEAKRITNELIKINSSNKNLDDIFHELLNTEFIKYDMKVLYFIPSFLAENNYFIKSTNPFILEKNNN